MASTTYQKNLINDYLFGAVSFTPPGTYYLGLSTTTASVVGVTEPSGGGYARVPVINTKSYFTYSTSGCLVNSGSIAFAQSSGSWGTVVDAVLFDALTSGSARFTVVLPSPIVVQANTIISFSASQITFSQQ